MGVGMGKRALSPIFDSLPDHELPCYIPLRLCYFALRFRFLHSKLYRVVLLATSFSATPLRFLIPLVFLHFLGRLSQVELSIALSMIV